MAAPPSRGSKIDPWQLQKRVLLSPSDSSTSQPEWVQIAEYATMSSAACSRVYCDSVEGLSRASTTRCIGLPFFSTSPLGESAHAISTLLSNGTSSGVSGMSESSPWRTSQSPSAGRASFGSWERAWIGVSHASTRPAAVASTVRRGVSLDRSGSSRESDMGSS